MGLDGALEMMHRLAAYLGELTTVVGHASRVQPMMAYCAGLLMTPGRRNAETMAVATKPACVPAQHQSLMHIVANSEWSYATTPRATIVASCERNSTTSPP